jgi:peptidoglycan/xylan/chitin deacetylase (PgdA/CDA1 family)
MCADQLAIILTYHSIADGGSPLETPPKLFAEQMDWLRCNAQVIPLESLVAALASGKPIVERAVVLTFDDGFEDFCLVAAPILRRLRFPATIFLPTAYCGRTNSWPGQSEWAREQPLMGWNQVRELAEQGFRFGAHGVTHPVLTELSSADAEREIARSREEIETQTGKSVDFFCYPYGRWNPSVRKIVERHYRGACSTGASVVGRESDLFALPRVDVHYLQRPAWFRQLFKGRLRTYLLARRLIRTVRNQPEGYLVDGRWPL